MLKPTLTFTAPSANQLQLNWEAIEGAISYTIQYRTSQSDSWTSLETTDSCFALHRNLAVNTLYYYRISAHSENDLVWSDEFSAKIYYTNSCTVSKSASAMTIAWTGIADVNSWIIERSPDNVNWAIIATNVEGTSYADTTFELNTWYYYRVCPRAPTGAARQANNAYALWKQGDFSATILDATSVYITCPNPTGYYGNRTIQRATSPDGPWSTVANLNANSAAYSNSGLTAKTSYYYRMFCVDSNYPELYVLSDALTLPNAITNLVAIRSGDVVLLSWDALETATEYTILKSTDQINWTEFTETDPLFCDDSPVTGATNYYKVLGTVDGESYASSIASLLLIGTPVIFTAVAQSNGNVALNWSACTGASYYHVQRRESGTSEWITLASNLNRLYYNDNLGFERCCDYRVMPLGGNWKQINSVWIPNVSALEPTVAALNNGVIQLNWTGLPNACEYDIARATAYNGTYEKIASSRMPSYSDANVEPNATYYYKIGFDSLNMWCSYVSATAIKPEPGESVLDFNAVSASELEISWPQVAHADSYTLQYRASESSAWTNLITTSETSYLHTGLSYNTDLFYRHSVNTASHIEWSRQHRIRISYLTSLTANVTATAITLNWSSLTGVTEYIIERSSDGISWQTLSKTASGTSYADTTFAYNTNYQYRVTPTLPGGAAREISVTGWFLIDELSATLQPDRSVSITFTNPTSYPGTRTLYRTVEPTWTNPVRIATSSSLEPNVILTDTTATAAATCYYWLQCGTAEPTRSDAIFIPHLISSFTAFTTEDRICLSWDDVENASRYSVFRSLDKIHWTEIVCDSHSLIESEFDVGTEYFYYVKTIANHAQWQSNLISAIVFGAPETLTMTRGTAGGGWGGSGSLTYRFNLSWSVCNGATGYTVQYRTADSEQWNTTSTSGTTTYLSITVDRNVWYYVRVKPAGGPVWKELGPIWYPNMTDLYPDIALTEDGYLRILWSALPNAQNYTILRSTSYSSTYETIAQTSDTSFIDRSAMPNTRYYYKIGFPNDDLTSVYVTEVSGNYPAPPSAIRLSNQVIRPDTTAVGTLTTTSLNTGYTYTYTLIDGEGDDDNPLFRIEEDVLQSASPLTEGTYTVRIRSTEPGGLYVEAFFEIQVIMPTLATPNFYLRSISNNSAQFYWNAVANASFYHFEYKKESDSEWMAADLAQNYNYSYPYLLSGLSSNAVYQFRLKACAEGYHDSTCAELSGSTLADTNPPVITLASYNDLYIEPGGELTLPAATAYDAVDGPVPVHCTFLNANDEQIETINTTIEGSYTILWTASDLSGNSTTRSIHLFITDKVPPVITVAPYAKTDFIHTVLPALNDYVEYGATALDHTDGPCTVTTSNNFNDSSGIYCVTYSAADSSENTATETRFVVISNANEPALSLTANVDGRVIVLRWSFRQEIPVILQRRTRSESDWTNLADSITTDFWSDATVQDNTLYFYRLIAQNGIILSNEVAIFLSDTTPPGITVHNYGQTGFIDTSVPLGSDYIEYGVTAADLVDPNVTVITENSVDTTKCGLYRVRYTATDQSGHNTAASRTILVYDDHFIAVPDFKAAAISQSTVRLTWPNLDRLTGNLDHLTVNIERRTSDSQKWNPLATGITGNTFDDTTAEPLTLYYYRITMPDGPPLTAEDPAWLLRVIHYSTVVQPVTISAIETTIKQKWSVMTQFTRTWTSITEVNG